MNRTDDVNAGKGMKTFGAEAGTEIVPEKVHAVPPVFVEKHTREHYHYKQMLLILNNISSQGDLRLWH